MTTAAKKVPQTSAAMLKKLGRDHEKLQARMHDAKKLVNCLDYKSLVLPTGTSVFEFIEKHTQLLSTLGTGHLFEALMTILEDNRFQGNAVDWFRKKLANVTFEQTESPLWPRENSVEVFLLVLRFILLTSAIQRDIENLDRAINEDRCDNDSVFVILLENVFNALDNNPFWDFHK